MNIPYIPKQLLINVFILLVLFLKNNDTVRLITAIFTILDIAIYAAIPNVNINKFNILDLLLIVYIADIDILKDANKYTKKEYSKVIDFFIASLGFNK